MKDKIHPAYKETVITCVCGETIHTRSTRQSIHVDICSKCHPFFTGKQKLVDSAGRVEKFTKRYAGKKKAKRPADEIAEPEEAPKADETPKTEEPKVEETPKAGETPKTEEPKTEKA